MNNLDNFNLRAHLEPIELDITKIRDMNRYFLVFLNGANPDGSSFSISCTTKTDNGKYISQRRIIDELESDPCNNRLCITNIIELSESDYNDYIK